LAVVFPPVKISDYVPDRMALSFVRKSDLSALLQE